MCMNESQPLESSWMSTGPDLFWQRYFVSIACNDIFNKAMTIDEKTYLNPCLARELRDFSAKIIGNDTI